MPKKLMTYMHNTTCRIKIHAHQTLENMNIHQDGCLRCALVPETMLPLHWYLFWP